MCDEADKYESGGIFTVAGPTGSYYIQSPFNTECEWALWDASAVTGSGLVAISASNPSLLNMTSSTGPTIGLLSGGTENNAFDGILVPISATQNHIPFEFWQPLGRGKGINIALTMSSGAAFIAITFRRKLEKQLPTLVSKKPSTHTPLSGHRQRTFMNNWGETSHMPGAAINVVPEEDTSTSKGHMPPGKNPMANLQRKAKRNG